MSYTSYSGYKGYKGYMSYMSYIGLNNDATAYFDAPCNPCNYATMPRRNYATS